MRTCTTISRQIPSSSSVHCWRGPRLDWCQRRLRRTRLTLRGDGDSGAELLSALALLGVRGVGDGERELEGMS